MQTRSLARSLAVLVAALALAACGGAASPSPQSGGGAPSPGSSQAGPTEPNGAGGPDGFEGTLTSSGVYSATWTVVPGMAANPFNASNNPSLTSDKGTFGNIKVELDGKVSFGSAATELSNGSYDGTGAEVTLDSSDQFVCAFTLDTDLMGSNDKAVLHLSGSMTVHWHPEGVGGMSCPLTVAAGELPRRGQGISVSGPRPGSPHTRRSGGRPPTRRPQA